MMTKPGLPSGSEAMPRTVRGFLPLLTQSRLDQLSRDLGMAPSATRAKTEAAIVFYCTGYSLTTADLLARWPRLGAFV